MPSFDWCEDIYRYWPDSNLRGTSLVLLILGGACFISFLSIIYWLHIQNTRARKDGFSEGRTTTLIFPLYTKILWLGAFATLVDAAGNLFTPTDFAGTNSAFNSWMYGGVWACYHFVFEGVACLMLNDGVGSVAAKRSAALAGSWAIFTWVVQGWITYKDGTELAIGLSIFWAACLVIFYGCLWLLPISVLFRRPCVFPYARFWCLMRSYICLSNVLHHYGVNFGFCMYLVGTIGFQSPMVAWVVYTCLLRDCKYWLGILSWEAKAVDTGMSPEVQATPNNPNSLDTLRRPLLGTSLAPHSARVLAAKMDSNKMKAVIGASNGNGSDDSDADGGAISSSNGTKIKRKGVKILNFAFLRIDQPVGGGSGGGLQQVILGSGSSCRVFQGTFRDRPVAIKMIFCPELTPDVVVSFYHEATLLAQLQHVNVVEVFGVCVLPPSICLVMELCDGGNLFDFLRAPPQQRQPLTLWRQLSLAWDCCAAVQFLHTHVPAILHLDLKSLNFLLTKEGRVKVADLELSREIMISSDPNAVGNVVAGSELTGFKVPETLYWLAPEIILGQAYNEKADIYALALVLWEIFTASVPYRSLEESLITAAKNVKYLELMGCPPGTYPPNVAYDYLPYSFEHGLQPSHPLHRPSMDGSVDQALSSNLSGVSSRKESLSTNSSVTHRAHTDSSTGNGTTLPSTTNPPSQLTVGIPPTAVAPSAAGVTRSAGGGHHGRRSVSSSSRRYPDDEEQEMSTPSSAGSSKSQSGAPSPSLNAPAAKQGYFLGGSNPTGVSQSPPPLTAFPAATTSIITSSSLPTITSGVSLLTHENLAGLTGGPPTASSFFPHSSALGGSHPPQYAPDPHETDPILLEWKRMHRQMHENPLPVHSAPQSSPFLPAFGSNSSSSSQQFRPPTTRLPTIPASIGNASQLNESVRNSAPISHSILVTSEEMQHRPSDSDSHPSQIMEDSNIAHEPTSEQRPHSNSQSQTSEVGGSGSSSNQPPLTVRSAPFQSDLSPILASVAQTPATGSVAKGDQDHYVVGPASPLPPPVLPHASSAGHHHSPSSSVLPARLFSAPQPGATTRLTESYVQYDDNVLLNDEAVFHSPQDQPLLTGGGDHEDSAFEPAAFYPSTVPTARSILSARSSSPPSAVSSISRGGGGDPTHDYHKTAPGRLVGPGSVSVSGVNSPTPSTTGSEATARIPRVSRTNADRSKTMPAPGGSSSRKKRTGTTSRPKANPVTIDYRHLYVSRHDIQTQLQHLICHEHYRPTLPPDMPDALAVLLTRAWNPNMNLRPTATEFVQTIAELLDQLKERTNRHAFEGARL